jgi:hypothetical protein
VGHQVDRVPCAEYRGDIGQEQTLRGRIEVTAVSGDEDALAEVQAVNDPGDPAFVVLVADGATARDRAVNVRTACVCVAAERGANAL